MKVIIVIIMKCKSKVLWGILVTDPFESGPNKGPPPQCHLSQQNETEFGLEAKESFIL